MANPYTHTEPQKGREGFHNRSSELTRIASRIAANRPQSISVVGGPKSGKTSLIRWLSDAESQQEYLEDMAPYVMLRLSLEIETPDTPPAFFGRIDAALQHSGEEPLAAPSFDGFNGVVKKLMGEQRKLVLFLDDFGLITQNEGFPLDFFSFMRSIANSNDVGYVTTSSAPLQQLCHTQDIEESPFFNIFTTVNLEPFSEAEARQMIAGPADELGRPFDGESTEAILALGGGSPYLLQLSAHLAFEHAGDGRITPDELAERAFGEARPFLESRWSDASEAQQEVLRAVSSGTEVKPRHRHAAESLERHGLLRQEGAGYRFSEGLMARYVSERGKGGFFKRLFG